MREFILKSEKQSLSKGNSNKFSVNNGNKGKGEKSVQNKKKRIEDGARFEFWEWKLLTKEECERVKQNKAAKKNANKTSQLQGDPNRAGGGLPSQYQVQNGIISLPPGAALPEGTMFIPMTQTPVNGVVNNMNGVQSGANGVAGTQTSQNTPSNVNTPNVVNVG